MARVALVACAARVARVACTALVARVALVACTALVALVACTALVARVARVAHVAHVARVRSDPLCLGDACQASASHSITDRQNVQLDTVEGPCYSQLVSYMVNVRGEGSVALYWFSKCIRCST